MLFFFCDFLLKLSGNSGEKILTIKWHLSRYSDRMHNLDNSVFVHPVEFLEECAAPFCWATLL